MGNLRDLSCRERCSLLLNARAQNWHLYFFSFCVSGPVAFRLLVGDSGVVADCTAPATVDILQSALAAAVSMEEHSQRRRLSMLEWLLDGGEICAHSCCTKTRDGERS